MNSIMHELYYIGTVYTSFIINNLLFISNIKLLNFLNTKLCKICLVKQAVAQMDTLLLS